MTLRPVMRFAEAAIALHHTKIPDADELVKHRSTANEGIIPHLDVPGQKRRVRDDVVIPQNHVVG